MSILIKGVDLPEAYTSAWLTVFECVGEHTFMKTHKVSAEQIQAIPPHGRLIDGDNVIKLLREQLTGDRDTVYEYYDDGLEMAISELSIVPTIIEAEEGETA